MSEPDPNKAAKTEPQIFEVLTLFPEMIEVTREVGVIGRACREGRLEINARQLRDYTGGSPHPIDDSPYGGGPGMVMRPDPIFTALEDIGDRHHLLRRILLTPQGQPFKQATAQRLASEGCPILLFCARYEGIDERARELFDEEISIGDYVLTGGELGAMVIIDAVGRLIPGVLGSDSSSEEESFSEPNRLEYPQYTRPAEFRGQGVPSVLTSGNHAAIREWRREQSAKRTAQRRPDLLKKPEN